MGLVLVIINIIIFPQPHKHIYKPLGSHIILRARHIQPIRIDHPKGLYLFKAYEDPLWVYATYIKNLGTRNINVFTYNRCLTEEKCICKAT